MLVDDDNVTRRVLHRRTYLRATGRTALGTASDGDTDVTMPQTLLVESDGTASYRFDVSGDVIPVPTPTAVRDSIDDGTVAGRVTDGVAAYRFTGDVTTAAVDGDARVEYGPTDDDCLPEPVHVLTVTAPADTTYELTTTGLVEPLRNGDTPSDPDPLCRNDDGTRTVTATGDGAFAFQGTVTDVTPAVGPIAFELDGEPVSAVALTDGDAVPTRELLVTSPTSVEYAFAATAGIVRPDGDDTRETDPVSRTDEGAWHVADTVGDGSCDTYTVAGRIRYFRPERGDVSVLVDGEPVRPRELVATDLLAHAGSPVGGGDGYEDTLGPTDATTTVSTADELVAALADATPGDIVFLDGDSDIDATGTDLRVPAGVTLASNRARDAAPGGRIRTTEQTRPLVTLERETRLTGLRLAGPEDTFVAYDGDRAGLGVDVTGSSGELDNCELSGFADAAVRCGDDTAVHHCYVHHVPMETAGTAVRCTDGQPIVEYNYVNYTRRGVTATGDGGATVAYNRFGSDVLDHAVACDRGGTLDVHHNTFATATDDKPRPISLDGIPETTATIANNWFESATTPTAPPDCERGTTVVRTASDALRNVEFVGNHVGCDEPSRDIGHPR
jgi:hypothetical protein